MDNPVVISDYTRLQGVLPIQFLPALDRAHKAGELAADRTSLNTLVKTRPEDRQLRIQFQEELSKGDRVDIIAVVQGICGVDYLVKAVERPYYLAWLLSPVATSRVVMAEMLEMALEKLRAILELPDEKPILEDGELVGHEVDPRILSIKLKALDMLDKRLHGAYTQRIEAKSMVVTKSAGSMEDIVDLDRRIAELEGGSMPVALAASETVIPKITGTR
jgi:hypothetical protein